MGSTAPKRYNDENVNYGNRMQANGNRYGLEGQLGCSKVEIDKKRKLAAMQMTKKAAPKDRTRVRIYQQAQDDEDDF